MTWTTGAECRRWWEELGESIFKQRTEMQSIQLVCQRSQPDIDGQILGGKFNEWRPREASNI
ncbi:hypothetical protein CQ019_01670 [Arthrobacter sp. MYb229]|nr:hypothetical protein CQ019_01670 [Arthrobacter sp. MYb229]PRB53045.1 hypothetical protein CQ013_01670 [Arthrobacter sp. MYb216]